MEMNSSINRGGGMDNRTHAMNQLAEFQELRDEEICEQHGVELVPDDDEDASIASRFESNGDEGEEEKSSDLMGQDPSRLGLADYGLTKQKLAYFDSCT